MELQVVSDIEKYGIVFVGLALLISLAFWSYRITLGIAVGGVLGIANFYGIRRIVMAGVKATAKKQAILAFLFLFKFGALAALVYISITKLPINTIAFFVGIAMLFLSLLLCSFKHMRQSQNGGNA